MFALDATTCCCKSIEVKPNVGEESGEVQDCPPFLNFPTHDSVVHGEAKRNVLTSSGQAKPLTHAMAGQAPKQTAVVALTCRQFYDCFAIGESGTEWAQNVLLVIGEIPSEPNAPRTIVSKVFVPMLQRVASASPVLLQCCFCNGMCSLPITTLGLDKDRKWCRDSVVCSWGQNNSLFQWCFREHSPADLPQGIRPIDHHEVVGYPPLSRRFHPEAVEVGDSQVHPLVRGLDAEQVTSPESASIGCGRCNPLIPKEEHLSEDRLRECHAVVVLLA
mmetsp:Transcript_173029/g.420902  ORF Transcript_173029/g.420902 Transcript_173029/m.420902 type:complete len:275 (+) Transcript_173029:319-1143(+)